MIDDSITHGVLSMESYVWGMPRMNTTSARPGELLSDPQLGLSYRLMQPVPAKPRRCVILLHGVGSNEVHMASLATSMPADTLVVLARGLLTLGPGQYAWFRVAFGANGPSINKEEAEHSRQTLIQWLQKAAAPLRRVR